MKIASAAYPMDELDSWQAYADKIEAWVAEAAGQGADLLMFPEYAAMELAMLAGREVATDLEPSLRAVSDRMPEADALHSRLAVQYGVHILGGSAPVFDDALGPRPVNRAAFFGPGGGKGVVDKQIMTRWEREPMACVGGGPLKAFDTALGRVGVLICYDCEFPLLGRALQDVDILLVPSCTETLAGYWRVRIGAMARALEQQCVSAMSSLVGPADWCEVCDVNTGAGGVFGPPDKGFPPTGVLAEGVLDAPGWTVAQVDLEKIAQVRADGGVLNRTHWAEQAGRDGAPTVERLQ
ncbi:MULTISPECIES: carbon-nitrogen hydrolase family protein [unclassified Roseovarius]|uniref:carbon-nitrogen hydrolase family protein n=1 Tax=unclassified Roseovarius TaxID=2614913 RepID=UPI00273F6E8C|nr:MULTISPECIES: carbon-nitrogen hydrolase family protein [unclassified Roseovarius]